MKCEFFLRFSIYLHIIKLYLTDQVMLLNYIAIKNSTLN